MLIQLSFRHEAWILVPVTPIVNLNIIKEIPIVSLQLALSLLNYLTNVDWDGTN